jgi:hypothetical protein
MISDLRFIQTGMTREVVARRLLAIHLFNASHTIVYGSAKAVRQTRLIFLGF